MLRICVYAGSSLGASPAYAGAAAAFGSACARQGFGIVYGGGGVGLMGVLADSVLAAGGTVIGVIPRAMIAEERAHHRLTELIPVETMHERKHRMAQLADSFVALPGGIGTLEEVVEIFTWLQLGLHLKPVGLLNVSGFYDPLLRLLDHLRHERFLTPAHRAMLTVESEPDALLDRLAATKHVSVPKPVHATGPTTRAAVTIGPDEAGGATARQLIHESCGYQRIPAFGPYVGNPVSVCYEKELKASEETGVGNEAASKGSGSPPAPNLPAA